MAEKSSEPKTFDTVTILGIIVAIAIMLGGQWHFSKKRTAAEEQAKRDLAAQQERTRAEELRKKKEDELKAPTVKPGPNGTAEANPQPPVAPPPPDVVTSVKADFVELEFSSRGAGLKNARLPNVDENATKKDKKGLDLLTEFLPGRRTFGLPWFKIGPPEGTPLILDEKSPDCLDGVVWKLTDSGAFDSNGTRVIAYEVALKGPVTSATGKPLDYTLTKTFTVYKSERFIRCAIKVENKSGQDVDFDYNIYGPQGILLDGPPEDPKGPAGSYVTIQSALAGRGRSSTATGEPFLTTEPDIIQIDPSAAKEPSDEGRAVRNKENLWGAVKNRFFMAMLVSCEPRQLQKIESLSIHNEKGRANDKRFEEPNIGVKGFRTSVVLRQSSAQTDPYALYLGPAEDTTVEAVEVAMKNPAPYYMKEAIKYYDLWNWNWPRVDWIARQMMWLFGGLYKIFGSFGVAVALMTILIKACLHPLQRKMMVSMSKMAKLQPDLNKIKEKYKNATSTEAKMKMTQEQQDVMRKAGVNPAAGCLPMLVQIPVFTALYAIFNHAFEMRGAEFLWIKDLSQPDRLYTFASISATSWIPRHVNLLPIIYIGLSYVQTKMTPQAKSDDPQQEMNRKMMMFMPVIISLMFYSMPAGLVLYFAVSACWGMAESWYIKKFLIKDPGTPTPPDAPKASDSTHAVATVAR